MTKKKKQSETTSKDVFIYDDHKLVSRRDFLNAGLIQFSAAVTAPTVASWLLSSNKAFAAACADAAGTPLTTLPAFVQLNLSGGAGLSANFIPRDRSGNLISSYSLMGLGSRAVLESNRVITDPASPNRMETVLGANAGFYFQSGFLQGLRDAAAQTGITAEAAAYLDKTVVVGVLAQSRDDTNTNHFDVSTLVTLAGMVGTTMPVLSSSGFGQMGTLVKAPTSLTVNSLNDLNSAVGVAGELGRLSNARQVSVFNLIKKLGDREATRLLASNSVAVKDQLFCATSKNVDIVSAPKPDTDPRNQAGLNSVWGLTANTAVNNRELVFAGSVFNSLLQRAGSVKLEIGGYDYHNNTRTSGDTKDREAGLAAGRVLQTAAVMGKKVFLYVTTDGAVRSADTATDDRSVWVSDRGQAGTTIILAYDPAARPGVADNSGVAGSNGALPNQIGYLLAGQSSDPNFISGWNEERAAVAVFLNYLRFGYGSQMAGGTSKFLAEYQAVLNKVRLTMSLPDPILAADIDKVVRFA